RMPGFGGMFIGPDNTLVVNLLDMSPEAVIAARAAIVAVFGEKRIPVGGIKPIQAKYDFLTLRETRDRAKGVLTIPGVVLIDIDEKANRFRVGIAQMAARADVERELDRSGVVRDMVIFEVVKPSVGFVSLQDLFRPVMGGFQIENSAGGCAH